MDESEIASLEALESSHWWYCNRKVTLQKWLNTLSRKSTVLDAGSASGGNTLLLIQEEFEVTSVELSSLGVEIQTSKGIKVVQASITEMPFADNYFDAFICMDVLEHIESDTMAMRELHRVLKPGGKFLVSVPEDPKLWSSHDVAVSHFRRYEKEEIFNKLRESNLMVDALWSSNVLLKPVLKMLRKRSTGSDLKKMNAVLNLILLMWANLEQKTFLIRFSGTTLWINGHKESAI